MEDADDNPSTPGTLAIVKLRKSISETVEDIPLDFDLGDSPVSIDTGGEIDLGFDGVLQAEFGVNLSDGIDLGGAFFETLNLLGVLDREQMADPNSEAFRQGLDIYRELHAATPGFVWLSTEQNRREDQLAAGASWLRLNLAATKLGLSLHPVSQTLQEYPEMATHLLAIHEELEVTSPARVQMLGRIGYGPEVGPSPRWPLQSRIRT